MSSDRVRGWGSSCAILAFGAAVFVAWASAGPAQSQNPGEGLSLKPAAAGVAADIEALRAMCDTLLIRVAQQEHAMVPRGAMVPFFGVKPPEGFVWADGKAEWPSEEWVPESLRGQKVPNMKNGGFPSGPDGNIGSEDVWKKLGSRLDAQPAAVEAANFSGTGSFALEGTMHDHMNGNKTYRNIQSNVPKNGYGVAFIPMLNAERSVLHVDERNVSNNKIVKEKRPEADWGQYINAHQPAILGHGRNVFDVLLRFPLDKVASSESRAKGPISGRTDPTTATLSANNLPGRVCANYIIRIH